MDGWQQRAYWVQSLIKIAEPVLENLGQRRAQAADAGGSPRYPAGPSTRTWEALGRTLAGIAPWLACRGLQGEEEKQRARLASLAQEALDMATDPGSPDYLNFHQGMQPIVDAAFLADAILRAPAVLWEALEARVQRNLVAGSKRRGWKETCL